jgi:general nucleoside transport system permease protein
VAKFRIERAPAALWKRALVPVVAVVVTIILTSVLVILAKANPFEAYYYFLIDPLSNKTSLIEMLVKSTPLLLTGAAAVFAFSAGYWNIGGEGQLLAGALVAAWLGVVLEGVSPWVGIPVMIVGGFIGGALWALPSAWLKVKLAVDEVVTTLLLNSVILFIISWVLNDPWRPDFGWPQSPEIDPGTMFFKLIPRTRLHFGFIVALVVIAVIWFIISRTPLGLQMRALGLGREAARFTGVKVERTLLISALVSGGIAGLAGVGEVAGIHFHLIEAISEGLGYDGVIVATLAGINPLGVLPAALFMGLIDTGARTVSTQIGVPVYLGNVVQATLLLVTLSMFLLVNYRIRRS